MEHTKLPTLSKAQEKLFELLVQKAVANERCPTNQWLIDNGFARGNTTISSLAYLGYVRIEVYTKNWRVVTILTGKHKEASTAPPPMGTGAPYRIIGSNGDSLSQRIARHPTKPVSLPEEPDWKNV